MSRNRITGHPKPRQSAGLGDFCSISLGWQDFGCGMPRRWITGHPKPWQSAGLGNFCTAAVVLVSAAAVLVSAAVVLVSAAVVLASAAVVLVSQPLWSFRRRCGRFAGVVLVEGGGGWG